MSGEHPEFETNQEESENILNIIENTGNSTLWFAGKKVDESEINFFLGLRFEEKGGIKLKKISYNERSESLCKYEVEGDKLLLFQEVFPFTYIIEKSMYDTYLFKNVKTREWNVLYLADVESYFADLLAMKQEPKERWRCIIL